MSNSMGLTVEAVRMALDATSLRQKYIADNIANVNTPGHIRMKVVFEDRLAQALENSAPIDENAGLSASNDLSWAEPEVLPASSTGDAVRLDREMVDLSSNTMRYHALAKALNKYFSLASAITAPGRG